MSYEQSTPDRERNVSSEVRHTLGHQLVAILERVPGAEPTDVAIDLTDGPSYRTRYWRCLRCGEERNSHREFRSRCSASPAETAVADGGYSVEDPRTQAALSDQLRVYPSGYPNRYEVRSPDEGPEVVNVVEETCTCEDALERGAYCKHLRRVDIEVRTGTIQHAHD